METAYTLTGDDTRLRLSDLPSNGGVGETYQYATCDWLNH